MFSWYVLHFSFIFNCIEERFFGSATCWDHFLRKRNHVQINIKTYKKGNAVPNFSILFCIMQIMLLITVNISETFSFPYGVLHCKMTTAKSTYQNLISEEESCASTFFSAFQHNLFWKFLGRKNELEYFFRYTSAFFFERFPFFSHFSKCDRKSHLQTHWIAVNLGICHLL